MYDIIIIGAGPAGLSAAIAAQRADLNYLVLEKGAVTNTIVGYPLETAFFSTANNLTIGNIPWATTNVHPTRLDALTYYRMVVEHLQLNVNVYEQVVSMKHGPEQTFVVHTTRRDGSTPTYHARAVIAASGSYDTPNKFGIAGDDLPKVLHYYSEGHPYYRQNVVVVGGGNSAAEATLDLFYHGANVTMIHQFAELDARIKPWIKADLQAWNQAGKITIHWETVLTEITQTSVSFRANNGYSDTIPNDWIFAMIGYRPDTTMLESVGVTVDADAVPSHNPETWETNVPNLFLAGVLAAGSYGSKIFIENGREHGPKIVQVLRERWGDASQEHRT